MGTIDNKYNPYLARIFSSNVISELIKKGRSDYVSDIINSSGYIKQLDKENCLKDFFEKLYNHLSRTYRNEYIYKNAIANKILLGKHSLNTSFMLMEFRVANCKADTVILNGTSNAYEIKTELDSLDRLKRQISAYEKVFDMVHVIAAPSQIEKVTESVGPHVGLMELSHRNTIKSVRKALSGKANTCPDVIFESLRKPEYISIIKNKFGYIPDVPNTQIHRECKKRFSRLSPDEAHDAMVTVLKKRGSNKLLKDFITNLVNIRLSHSEFIFSTTP
ncbi:MAG: sce7726 family protein [Desulfobacterium sp.]|nr:sce7726 family protein [Desulfobacterium sp.]